MHTAAYAAPKPRWDQCQPEQEDHDRSEALVVGGSCGIAETTASLQAVAKNEAADDDLVL